MTPGGPGDPFAIVHGLYWLTVNMAARQPVLVAVDDAHWADPASLRWLAYLGTRLDGLDVAVVVARRPAEPGSGQGALLAIRVASPAVRPALLSPLAVAAIVRWAPRRRTRAAALRDASGGNPFYLDELLRAEAGTEAGQGPRQPASEAVARHVEARIRRLDPAALGLAQALAAADASAGRQAALGWLEEALALTSDPRQRAEIAHEVAQAYAALFRWVEAVDVTDRALAELGGRDPALAARLALAGSELADARVFGGRRALGIALRVAGLALGGAEGARRLNESVDVLRESPTLLERAKSLTELGAALRRAGQRVAARPLLVEALDLAADCGAGRWPAAHAELTAAGGGPRRERRHGLDALTPSELRVARLAADGNTNRQIAHGLYVTLKTVETHLAHVYAKLGISHRGELPEALAGETSGWLPRREAGAVSSTVGSAPTEGDPT